MTTNTYSETENTIMTKNTESDNTIKAFKILQLNEDYAEIERKRKAVVKAFGAELKRIKSEISDILNDESTEKELLANVHDIHDTDKIK